MTTVTEPPGPAAEDPPLDPARFVRRVEFVDSVVADEAAPGAPVHVTYRVLLDGHDITKLLYLPWTAPGGASAADRGPTGRGSYWPYYLERPFDIGFGEDAEAIITLDLLPTITVHPWNTGRGGVDVDSNTVYITCPDGAVLEPLLVANDPPGGIPAQRIRLTPTGNGPPPQGLAAWIEHGRTRYRLRMFAADIVFRPKES